MNAKTTKIRATVTIEVDVEAYRASYGDEDLATIRESVRYAISDGINAVLSQGIVNVTVAELNR